MTTSEPTDTMDKEAEAAWARSERLNKFLANSPTAYSTGDFAAGYRAAQAEFDDVLLDVLAARRGDDKPKMSLEELCTKLDAAGVRLKVDPAQIERLQARIAAERAAAESKQPSAPEAHQGMDTPWPLRDVLERLADFAHERLTVHDYDGNGWEELQRAKDTARVFLATWPGKREPEAQRPTNAELIETLLSALGSCRSPVLPKATAALSEIERRLK